MRRPIILVTLLALLPIGLSAQPIREERVSFAPGTSGAAITGQITGSEIVDYVLGAGQGQQITIDFSTDNPSAYFNLLQGNDPTALHNASINGNHFGGTLPASGDYRIRVYLFRNAARRGEVADYNLSVTIGGAAAVGNDFADGLAGGPDWWQVTGLVAGDTLNVRSGPGTGNTVVGALASGDRVRNGGCRMNGDTKWCQIEFPGDQPLTGWVAGRYLTEAGSPQANDASGLIPCALSGSQPMGSCAFRVSRGTGGTASVWVTIPGGTERYLDFREGKLVDTDIGTNIHQERNGDLNLIWLDGRERYEIPDAVLFGG